MLLGGGCGGGGKLVLVVVVVVFLVMRGPVSCQTSNMGSFHLYNSCGSSVRLSYLVVNNSMWLRGTKENVTLITVENTSDPCVLPPDITHRVTVLSVEIHVGGAVGEEGKVCTFPRRAVLQLRQGVMKVSCLQEKSQADAEMLLSEFEVSPSSTMSPIMPRNLDLPPKDTIDLISTTLLPQISHEPLVASTPEPTKTETKTEHLETTETETVSTTKTTPLTDDMTTTTKETTEMPDATSDKVTKSKTTLTSDITTSATLDSNITQETDAAMTLTPPEGTHQSNITKENISSLELAKKNNKLQSSDDTFDTSEDQVIYLAGGGAGVLALVMGVVVIASVAHYRRRQQAKEKENTDLFISGGYKGSLNSLNYNSSQGAYLNAHEMYSGAEPEFVESIELEERALNSGVSYSSHDIPKCLRSCDV